MLVGYGYGSSSEEETALPRDSSTALGTTESSSISLELPTKRKRNDSSDSPQTFTPRFNTLLLLPNKRSKIETSVVRVQSVTREPCGSESGRSEDEDEDEDEDEEEEEEEEEEEKSSPTECPTEDNKSLPKGLDLSEQGIEVKQQLPALEENFIGPTKPELGLVYPQLPDYLEPEIQPHETTSTSETSTHTSISPTDTQKYPTSCGEYPQFPTKCPTYQLLPNQQQFIPYQPAPPPVDHILFNKGKWDGFQDVNGDVIDVDANTLHNQTFTKTELRMKKRLEAMTTKAQTRTSNRKGQLSVLILEAEQTSMLEEERREATRILRKETRKRYCW
eukprot:TRINITY_DN4247_c0_g2_i8.p1 TRINITY_DN4247_c0_g2~~TRINITY_DN4247_c0_g2_i8.p1  ORF type:complete len:333 (+),score=102.92 TRINITY_DN4247_c0_g2_i8:73-1071(+)